MAIAARKQPEPRRHEMAILRVVDATPGEVFQAWINPDHLLRWWGPREFTTAHVEVDPKPGGVFRTCIRSPKGDEYPASGTFREIERPHRLVFTHAWDDEREAEGDERVVTVKLAGTDGKTRVAFHIGGFETEAARDSEIEGWNECLDRLVRHFAAEDRSPAPATGRALQKITPFLWFDGNAEEAVRFYTSIFRNSGIESVMRYGDAGPGPKGSVMLVNFRLEGQSLLALNGGPQFNFSPAISLFVSCTTQAEIDELWEKLSEGGEKEDCGWLRDKYGVSWQIVPTIILGELLGDPATSQNVMRAMFTMKKLDIEVLKKASGL